MTRFTIGLTGGLASGKTTVLNLFQQLGVDTLSADHVVHQLMAKEGTAYTTIVNRFGLGIINKNHEIDRDKLRTVVFSSPEEKYWLETYLHPLVRKLLWQQREAMLSPYAMIEIPLLAETQTPYEWIQRILVVDCYEEIQLHRAEQRSGLPTAQLRHIMAQQATRQKRNSIAHDIIINDGDVLTLELEVKALHNEYLRLCQH
jgi:dephospho-CoA kinase